MKIEKLIGKTFVKVFQPDYESIAFVTESGKGYKLFHDRDCCESVGIEDIVGDLSDLYNTPIVSAYEEYSDASKDKRDKDPDDDSDDDDYDDDISATWSFYRIATIKGTVTIRFYGTSNGYYSESAALGDLEGSLYNDPFGENEINPYED